MKIKKIAARCVEAKSATIYDYIDGAGAVRQWIGAGMAMYPVDGMPYLAPEHLAALFGLTEKQLEKMSMSASAAPDGIVFQDAADHEILAEQENVTIIFCGEELIPVTAQGKTRFLNRKLLEPIWSEYDNTQFWLRRTPTGMPYFAVKAGLMLVGIVWGAANMLALADELAGIAEKAAAEDPYADRDV